LNDLNQVCFCAQNRSGPIKMATLFTDHPSRFPEGNFTHQMCKPLQNAWYVYGWSIM